MLKLQNQHRMFFLRSMVISSLSHLLDNNLASLVLGTQDEALDVVAFIGYLAIKFGQDRGNSRSDMAEQRRDERKPGGWYFDCVRIHTLLDMYGACDFVTHSHNQELQRIPTSLWYIDMPFSLLAPMSSLRFPVIPQACELRFPIGIGAFSLLSWHVPPISAHTAHHPKCPVHGRRTISLNPSLVFIILSLASPVLSKPPSQGFVLGDMEVRYGRRLFVPWSQ